ncbi:MAG: aryl-sulfate sulfotransferase, partial [Gammaproteobacteria bacterium]|nr:aryl-sulfate sulfotransferase [Gammaproteobacteria bacterium]
MIISISCLLISGCAMDQVFLDPEPIITVAPDVELDPNLTTPLAALLTLTTNVPTRINLEISTGKKSWTVDLKKLKTSHNIPVLGLRPDTTHSIKVHAVSESGLTTTYNQLLTVTTDPLPEGFPSIDVMSQPSKMEPGYTLVEVVPEGSKNKEFGALIIIVDHAGEVVWYTTGSRFTDVRQLANGNLIFLVGNKVRIINMVGDIIKEWRASKVKRKKKIKGTVATRSFHHELFPMENGNFLVLSVEKKNILNFPTSETNAKAPKEKALVAGDLVVEFDPDGNIVNSWSMLNMLQPQRIGFGSLGGYWNSI